MFAPPLQHRFTAPLFKSPLSKPHLISRPFTSSLRRLQDPKPPARTTPPPRPRRSNSDQLPILPLVFIFCLGSFLFYRLSKSREGQGTGRGPKPPALIDASGTSATMAPTDIKYDFPAATRTAPLFTPGTGKEQALVLFVLGGPGAGKGTQCANLVRDFGFAHLSAGDLLRAEQDRPGSQFGDMIRTYIKEGTIVPMEVTIQLLENAMTEKIEKEGNRMFLIDGFPRKLDQAVKFEEAVVRSKFTLFFDCPEEEMERRLLERGKTSGRDDDNIESIRKRFRTFVETSMPVVDMFEKEGRVVKVGATKTPEEVYKEVKEKFTARGIEPRK
ncbi:Uridylate kinase isoform B [Elsinoe australis]|uniref:Uridylate kinase n=1 Tax=Elsinoe australis TaxID=40998 RepID=A0A2P7Z6A7_9PEZI|nr:Uridylate kinase isoform B [Elsinoe australis]